MLRRLILAHYTPRPNGHLLQPPFCEGAWGAQTEASHLAKIGWLRENRIPTECYWIDAGWYGDRPIAEAADGLTSAWMRQVGSWSPNPEAYPRGFAPIGEAARAAGLGFLLWIEPERAFEGTQMVREHPDWLIGPVPSGGANGVNFMVNLGIPEARRHVTDLVSNLIRAGGISCYRQDFNDLRVPELFAMADAPDRVGMAEIGHITGLYAFWDELLARHPGLIIDNCAGGGQRIDLETISRSVPLWRSDLQCWPFDPLAMQTQTQGLAPWVPLERGRLRGADRNTRCAARWDRALVTHWSSQALDGGVDQPVEAIRRLMDEALAMRKYFYGDFYPLLAFSLADDAWAAWQYDRPDLGEGMVVAFRRHESPFPRWEARLQGLEPEADYDLFSWDDQGTRRMTGSQLMMEGFVVTIDGKPGSALFTYKRVHEGPAKRNFPHTAGFIESRFHCYTELACAYPVSPMDVAGGAGPPIEATWLQYASPGGADTHARRAFHFVAGAVHGPAGRVEQVRLGASEPEMSALATQYFIVLLSWPALFGLADGCRRWRWPARGWKPPGYAMQAPVGLTPRPGGPSIL